VHNDQDSAQLQPNWISVIWTSEVFRIFVLPGKFRHSHATDNHPQLKMDGNTQPFGRLDICKFIQSTVGEVEGRNAEP
jgi:hypothetical protein